MARLASLIAALLGIVFTSLVWADALPTAKPETSDSPRRGWRVSPRC